METVARLTTEKLSATSTLHPAVVIWWSLMENSGLLRPVQVREEAIHIYKVVAKRSDRNLNIKNNLKLMTG